MHGLRSRWIARAAAIVGGLFLTTMTFGESDALPEVLSLKLFNVHTNERATIVFKRNGVYDQKGLAELNRFLRDWRRNQPTKMDPHLFDLIWQVYRASGSRDYISVICGYRSPDTNGMLRRRSSGVAKNSLHMQGKAMDFFIPDVSLSKLRAIGLQLGLGGVGFYPTSGSPFVHMDTGTVRHWPRMTRQQLVAVFPNGKTLHVPSDGKPLPGYAQALAAYKARKASGVAVASFTPDTDDTALALASADDEDDSLDAIAAPPARKTVGAAVVAYATVPPPMPRIAPRPAVVVAAAVAPAAKAAPLAPAVDHATIVASLTPPRAIGTLAPDFDFGGPQDWSAPAVPSALASAMAERDQTRRGSSLPIAPTAVVATIELSRPLRAEAITTAVLRTSDDAALEATGAPQVLAYAAEPAMPPVVKPTRAVMTAAGVPLPQISPLRRGIDAAPAAKVVRTQPRPQLQAPDLTMTALDTVGLRMWIGPTSTRQKGYALLTMPDFGGSPDLMQKPDVTFAAGFSTVASADLRTDRFSGPLVQQPRMVDLTLTQVASIR